MLNPYCSVDFMTKIWVCPFCLGRNHFPSHYADISRENVPAEIMREYSTMEYVLPQPPGPPPTFVFVLDTCVLEEDLRQLVQSLKEVTSSSRFSLLRASLSLFPPLLTTRTHTLTY